MGIFNKKPAAPEGLQKPPRKKYVTVLIFIAFITVCFFIGMGIGRLMSAFFDASSSIGDGIIAFVGNIIIPAQWIIFGLLFVGSVACYLAARASALLLRKNEEDEAAHDRADALIGVGFMLSSANTIICYGIFGMSLSLMEKSNPAVFFSALALMAVVIVVTVVYSSMSVSFLKRLNPEKQGDTLAFNFQKKWFGSCDEAEKMSIYKASYNSFKAMGTMLMVVWVVTAMLTMYFHMSFYPMLVVTILWLTHTLSYQVACFKGKKKK